MFPSTETDRTARPATSRRAQAGPERPAASASLLRRVAGTLRAFAFLEDPELEARAEPDARQEAVLRAHHRRRASPTLGAARTRRPGAVRAMAQTCRSPLPR
jgi:hypothetical protein